MKRNEFNSYFSFRSNRLIFTKIQGTKRTNRQKKRTNAIPGLLSASNKKLKLKKKMIVCKKFEQKICGLLYKDD